MVKSTQKLLIRFLWPQKILKVRRNVIVKTEQSEGQNGKEKRRAWCPRLLSIFHLFVVRKRLTLKQDGRNE